jgi:multiple sugar transport system permease protein
MSMDGVRRVTRRNVALFIGALASIGVMMAFLLPYLNMALTSLKPPQEVFTVPPYFLPSRLSIRNYLRMVEYLPFWHYLRNSLIVTVASTILSTVIGTMGGYSFARYGFPLRKLLLLLTILAKMIPLIVIAVPVYLLMRTLRLGDTLIGLILVYTSINLPFVIWLMTGFFAGLPREMEEAGLIDGCGRLGIFARIIIPIAAPGVATTAIFSFMFGWNEFLFALLLTASKAKTMPVGISEFITVFSIEWGPMAATAVSFTVPILIFSLFVQRHIVTGMTLGAVKG